MSKKASIRDIVPENVSVEEPKVAELHRKLAGKQALPGSPQGREVHPVIRREGFRPGIDG